MPINTPTPAIDTIKMDIMISFITVKITERIKLGGFDSGFKNDFFALNRDGYWFTEARFIILKNRTMNTIALIMSFNTINKTSQT
ncbi:MAG TPA: hypothetical protein PLZ84_02820 [Clostridia bacterium]|nr:hypothetical protein [Clostridia bacterium]